MEPAGHSNSRFINEHHDGFALNDSIEIEAKDEPFNGASHEYEFKIDGVVVSRIQFQKGARNEPGSTPGVTTGAVLAVLLDTLRGFQSGPYPSRETAIVITKLEEALMYTEKRAKDRARRGVLGQHAK